jgi:hypothetical protein
MTSLTYAPTLICTNKSAIDLKIWKGHWFENTLKSPIWGVDADLSLSYLQSCRLVIRIMCPSEATCLSMLFQWASTQCHLVI